MKRFMFHLFMCCFAVLLLITGCGDNDRDAQTGWVVGSVEDGYGTIYFTQNGGDTWTRQGDASSVPKALLTSVRAVNASVAWIVGELAEDGLATILKTKNGGHDWIRLEGPGDIPSEGLLGVHALDENRVWAVGRNNTIIYTEDGGESWVDRSDPTYDFQNMSAVFALDDKSVWVCGGITAGGIILRSNDGGDTWTDQTDPDLLTDYPMISLSAVDENTAWVVGHGYSILNTSDGGASWNNLSPYAQGNDDANGVCAFNEDRIWVVMDHGNILLTEKGGQEWTEQESNAGGYLLLRICALDENTAWVVGATDSYPFVGIVLHTADGGQTWNQQSYGSDARLSDVSFAGSYH